MSELIITGKGRGSYLKLDKARPNHWDKEKLEYSMVFLFPKQGKGSETLTLLNAAIRKIKLESFSASNPPERLPLVRDGDETDKEGYPGHWYINLKAQTKPKIVDPSGDFPMPTSDVVSGDYLRCSLSVFAYPGNDPKGIACWLNNLQFIEKGEPLGGKTRAEDDFSSWNDEEKAPWE